MTANPGAPAVPVRFSTDGLDDDVRSSRWMAWNREALVGLDCATPDGRGLRGAETTLALPGLTVGHVRTGAHRVTRDEATIADSPADGVVLYAVLDGRTTFTGPDGDHGLDAGQVAIVDADRPFVRRFPAAFAELALKLPATAPVAPAAFVRAAAPARTRIGALARYLATSAPVALPADVVATVAHDLVADVTTGDGPGDRFALARLVVERRLAESGLSAGTLAAELGISVRHLSRLFADAGTTVPRHLTERRLAHAAALLATSHLPVAAVAARCGFTSAAYFTRVFRDRLGTTPSAYRDGPA